MMIFVGCFALYHGTPAYLGSPRSKHVSELNPWTAILLGFGLISVGVYGDRLKARFPARTLPRQEQPALVFLTGAARFVPHIYAAIVTLILLGYFIYSRVRGTSNYTPGLALGLVSFLLVYLWNWVTAHAIGWTIRRADSLPSLGKWSALLAGALPSLAFAGITVAEHLQHDRDIADFFASLILLVPLVYGFCFMPVYYLAKGLRWLGQ